MKKALKKIDKDDLKQLIQAIDRFKKETKDAEITSSSSKLSTKDLLFYFLTKYSELETRTTRVESSQKFMFWFTGISISVIALFVGVLKW